MGSDADLDVAIVGAGFEPGVEAYLEGADRLLNAIAREL